MGFAATVSAVPLVAWLLLFANIFWAIAYDTEYAMVDREDDLRLGLKTSAITFGKYDILCVALCYAAMLSLLGCVGYLLSYGWPYVFGLVWSAGLAVLHLIWIRHRAREACFRAFLHNTWIGFAVFVGIFIQTIIFP
jgi:4-hydroxybenzoate polyprenyltransferase